MAGPDDIMVLAWVGAIAGPGILFLFPNHRKRV